MFSSKAYSGYVTHERHKPKSHKLKYRVFYFLLDLDELTFLGKKLLLFSHNKFSPFSFYDSDHGSRDGRSLKNWVIQRLKDTGLDDGDYSIMVLCLPRMLGYVFNPISVYFCFDGFENLIAILYEVSNTFGESHTYVVPIKDGQSVVYRHSFKKKFYVSPFVAMDCTYHMTTRIPSNKISISIVESDENGKLLTATFAGKEHLLTDQWLFSAFFRYPMMTFKVIAGIYWEAFNLWRKRVPVFNHSPVSYTHLTLPTIYSE